MSAQEIEAILAETLEDRRLSRGERKALSSVLAESRPGAEEVARYLSYAFSLAQRAVEKNSEAKEVLDWVEEVVKTFRHLEQSEGPPASIAEAHFSPGDRCVQRIRSLIQGAQRSIEVCVFTITDDRISGPLIEAHARGVLVRVISDDDKSYDPGSDIFRLSQAKVPVRVDNSDYHMHHKFALFDRAILVTGSYNWTRGAAQHNEENLVVSNDLRLLKIFGETFEKLWDAFGD